MNSEEPLGHGPTSTLIFLELYYGTNPILVPFYDSLMWVSDQGIALELELRNAVL